MHDICCTATLLSNDRKYPVVNDLNWIVQTTIHCTLNLRIAIDNRINACNYICIVEPSKLYWNTVVILYAVRNVNNAEVKDILGHSYMYIL